MDFQAHAQRKNDIFLQLDDLPHKVEAVPHHIEGISKGVENEGMKEGDCNMVNCHTYC